MPSTTARRPLVNAGCGLGVELVDLRSELGGSQRQRDENDLGNVNVRS
jgi:hypothetical protein